MGVFLWGVDTAFFYVPARTLLQRYAPTAFHGRVLSLNQSLEPTAGIVMTPLAAVALGFVSVQVLGITAGVIATGRRSASCSWAGADSAHRRRRCPSTRPRARRATRSPSAARRRVDAVIPAMVAAADFTPGAVALLVASAVVAVGFALVFVVRWTASFPDLPAPANPPHLSPGAAPLAHLLAPELASRDPHTAPRRAPALGGRHLELFEMARGTSACASAPSGTSN